MNKFCKTFESLSINYNYVTDMIEVYRCCLKRNPSTDVIKCYSIKDWRNIKDLFSELETLVNIWPETVSKSVFEAYCGETTECFWDKPLKLKRVEVSLDYHCNLSCPFCTVKNKKNSISKEKLNELKNIYFETLYKLKGHQLESIRLTECGEPLFFKYQTIEFINSCSVGDFNSILLSTNGTLIDDEYIESFKNSKVKIIPAISLNGWNRFSYMSIMGKDNFTKVFESIFKLINSQVFPSLNFVYSSEDELKEMKKLETLFEGSFVNFHFQPIMK